MLDSDARLDSLFPKTLRLEDSSLKAKVMTTDTFYIAFPANQFLARYT